MYSNEILRKLNGEYPVKKKSSFTRFDKSKMFVRWVYDQIIDFVLCR